jgi:deoxyribodipyrimidine photo-lyase
MNNAIDQFPPTPQAALARLAGVDINDYAKSRNAIGGAVSRLSPYVTHGFLSFPQIAKAVAQQAGFSPQHKFVFELGWRAYFHHVWHHLGDGIFESLHTGVLPDSAYLQELPLDIQTASTGIPAIDQAVNALLTTGYLHNHARMWLASYVVHIRKVHWLVGANWMYGHLLDGDLASNMLSWQWVAGTGSSKPYLFNAENVAKYAPASWRCEGTVLDTSYEHLHEIASSSKAYAPSAPRQASLIETADLDAGQLVDSTHHFKSISAEALSVLVKNRHVYLVHPWSLGDLPQALPADALILGVSESAFHAHHPWSEQRWAWVMTRLQQLTSHCYAPSIDALQASLCLASSVHYAPSPHAAWLSDLSHPQLQTTALPKLFTDVGVYCKSFSQWWNKAKMLPLESCDTISL